MTVKMLGKTIFLQTVILPIEMLVIIHITCIPMQYRIARKFLGSNFGESMKFLSDIAPAIDTPGSHKNQINSCCVAMLPCIPCYLACFSLYLGLHHKEKIFK